MIQRRNAEKMGDVEVMDRVLEQQRAEHQPSGGIQVLMLCYTPVYVPWALCGLGFW